MRGAQQRNGTGRVDRSTHRSSRVGPTRSTSVSGIAPRGCREQPGEPELAGRVREGDRSPRQPAPVSAHVRGTNQVDLRLKAGARKLLTLDRSPTVAQLPARTCEVHSSATGLAGSIARLTGARGWVQPGRPAFQGSRPGVVESNQASRNSQGGFAKAADRRGSQPQSAHTYAGPTRSTCVSRPALERYGCRRLPGLDRVTSRCGGRGATGPIRTHS
ncbi:hypothetical protein pipiens_014499 [Culex pipiens pipiens]|uniref:Uncharacterized protein n=1 Tax=Culex pipiens pipiens TaxID=38569 RepID=A0ABD1CUD3_CULPP